MLIPTFNDLIKLLYMNTMTIIKKAFLFSFLFCFTVFPQTIDRIMGSPYPVSVQPDTLFLLTDANFTDNQILTIETLQGILAQKKPRIYRITSPGYQLWIDDLQKNYNVVVRKDFDKNFSGLINYFKSEIKSYVLCNVSDNSLNSAISLCGITNSIALTSENTFIATALKIPLLLDVRGDKDEFWFFQQYGSLINKNAFCFQKESSFKSLADYSVFGKMITFYNPSFNTNTSTVFKSFAPGAALFGWGFDEYQLVNETSAYSTFVHAADWANNLSTLSNFNATTKQLSSYTPAESPDSVHTVCFLMTDGDNIQWALNDFFTGTNWYGSPNRKKIDIGWTISPALSELAPTVLKKIYDTEGTVKGARDYFVAGPSGVGYIFPERYPDLNTYAQTTSDYMQKADLRILNLLGNNDDDKYIKPFVQLDNIDAIFYYFYSDYAGGKGKIKWVNNKPVIYGRNYLWEGHDTYSSLAVKLNSFSRNIHSADGYSLIPVQVWSRGVDDIVNCAKLLNSKVRVVAPDEFVALIKKNVPITEGPLVSFTPGNPGTEDSFLVPGYIGSGSNSDHRWADNSSKIVYHFTKSDLLARSAGNQNLKLDFTVCNEYVIKINNNLTSGWTEIFRWSTSSAPSTTCANRNVLAVDLKKYFDLGWQEIYVSFEDGLPLTGWGSSIWNVTITQIKNPSDVGSTKPVTPNSMQLNQNYPNPFNPSTSISYYMDLAGKVKIDVYDLLGRKVNTLVDSFKSQGKYSVIWNGCDFSGNALPGGVYLYCMSKGNIRETKKMVLLK